MQFAWQLARRLNSRVCCAVAVSVAALGSLAYLLSVHSETIKARLLGEVRRQLDWPFVYPDGDPVNDREMVEYVRRFVLEPPSREEYRLDRPKVKDPSESGHISKTVVPDLFPGVKNGVFVEAGALDGETISTSLYLEREFGWSGMLVEMTPLNHDRIRSKHRKAFFAPVCLSPRPWPIKRTMTMEYDPKKIKSRWGASIVEERKPSEKKDRKDNRITYTATVECFPLQTLLLAANMTKIDFLSLDLEGAELQVLKTMQWEKFDIKVVHMDLLHTVEGVQATKDFLASQGFVHYSGKKEPVLFLHEDFLSEHKARTGS